MARRRRSSRRSSMRMGAVKVCKLKGKKLVCRSMKGLGSSVLNGMRRRHRAR